MSFIHHRMRASLVAGSQRAALPECIACCINQANRAPRVATRARMPRLTTSKNRGDAGSWPRKRAVGRGGKSAGARSGEKANRASEPRNRGRACTRARRKGRPRAKIARALEW
jgi:hypothetical protein